VINQEAKRNMKLTQVLPLSLSLLLSVASTGAAFCSDGVFARLEKSASDAYVADDYKRADSQWHKALDRLNLVLSREEETKRVHEQIESTLRHLGECALAQKNYDSADDYLRLAKTACDSLQETDADLDKDFKDLAINYRLIDLTKLGDLGIVGPIVTAAIGDFHPNKVSVAKTDNGHHISVALSDDVIKDIGAKGVTQVGVNKNISFDLIQGECGAITLANIIGIRVHAGFWVNIINSSIKLDESQRAVALVTAQKMGISQTVSTPMPDMIYLPVAAIVSQVKSLFGEASSQPPAITASPTNGPATASPSAASNGATAGPSAFVSSGASSGVAAGASAGASIGTTQTEVTGVLQMTNTRGTASGTNLVPLPSAQQSSGIAGNTTGSGQNPGMPLPIAPAGQVPPFEPIVPSDTTTPEHVN
jgi:hypothetical protein